MHSKYAYRCQFLCGYTCVYIYPHTGCSLCVPFCLNHLCVIMRIHLKGIPASTTTCTFMYTYILIHMYIYMLPYSLHVHHHSRMYFTYHLHTLYPHTYVHTASCVHVVCRIYLPGKESEQYRGDRKRGREARRTAQTTNAFLFTCCLISSCKVQLHPLYTCTSCSSLYIHKALYTHTTQGLASVHTCVCDAVYVCISLASVHTKYNSRVVTHK